MTEKKRPNPKNGPVFEIIYRDSQEGRNSDSGNEVISVKYPEGLDTGDIRFAAPGTSGETRVLYRAIEGDSDWHETEWQSVDPEWDFTSQFLLEGLRADARYELTVEARNPDGGMGQSLEGEFLTAPAPDDSAKVMFAVSTGQMFDDRDSDDGFLLYDSISKLDPSFFVHTGDILYYDDLAKTKQLAFWHWQRMYSLPSNVRFHKQVGSYFMKDDHDTWVDDCSPTLTETAMYQFTFKMGQEIFLRQVPMGEKTYRTRRWGKDLQIWMVEGRDFRSHKDMEDGPVKTIWGAEQKAWFKESVKASDASFRILITPTPIVGPDKRLKRDNHSNADFAHEGNELREFVVRQKNMIIVCGDRHWQYHSVDPKTGAEEFSCGPASDAHAGGWKWGMNKDYHRFLRLEGGFLTVTVEREDNQPVMICRLHAVDGTVQYEKRFESE